MKQNLVRRTQNWLKTTLGRSDVPLSRTNRRQIAVLPQKASDSGGNCRLRFSRIPCIEFGIATNFSACFYGAA
jgi:hypothetical protein